MRRCAQTATAILPLLVCLAMAARAGAVVGGVSAPAGSFGFMAFVADVQPNGTVGLCSGTVIAPIVVLTAAHCGQDPTTGIVENPAQYDVVTGSLDWTSTTTRQVSGVSKVIIDPNYNAVTHTNDAALLQLSTPTTAQIVPLAIDPQDLGLLDPGTLAQFAGWGATATDAYTTSLQWGNTVVQNPTYCADEANLVGAAFNPYNQICVVDAPTFATSVCHGDSGGPLLASNALGQWIEIGVTSWAAASNCNTVDPQYFTRADAISAWAEGEIAALTPPPAPATAPPAISTAPTPAPATTKPTRPTHPLPGLYRGKTSTHQTVQLRISAANPQITSFKFGFKLKCSRGWTLTYSAFSPLSDGWTWKLNTHRGLGFSRSVVDNAGEQYSISGTFTPAGSVAGTVRTTWHSSRYGLCSSGTIKWSAHSSQLTSPFK